MFGYSSGYRWTVLLLAGWAFLIGGTDQLTELEPPNLYIAYVVVSVLYWFIVNRIFRWRDENP